jgi:indole-3-glycerol phosphate synthase
MTILEKIVIAKRRETEKRKETIPVSKLEQSIHFKAVTFSLEESLRGKEGFGIIAEFKKQSPSRGIINPEADPREVCSRYISSGASAVSILTDSEFFGGSTEDLINTRKLISAPVLRKDFIIDEYQIIESKSIGADVILLIADILNKEEMKSFSSLAASLGLEVLFEIHDESGIDKLPSGARLVGVNSRNLGNFSIDMDILKRTINKLPTDAVKIAESGIDSAETLINLKNEGFRGFLIGELFMRNADPGQASEDFIDNIKKLMTCK